MKAGGLHTISHMEFGRRNGRTKYRNNVVGIVYFVDRQMRELTTFGGTAVYSTNMRTLVSSS
eukprot:1053688-Heterocapsa_arctica.AAC.1